MLRLMSWGKIAPELLGIVALVLATTAKARAGEVGDWRLEILTEQGVPTETAALQKLRNGCQMTPERLKDAIAGLGADEFTSREQAQREILLMGKKALPGLRRLPPSDDPEVRVRLAEIERTLQIDERWAKEDLVREAVASLLRERLKERLGEPADPLYVELFHQPTASLAGGYRRLHLQADKGLTGLVSDGSLRLKGRHVEEGDQRLVLDAKTVVGKQEFPESFRIEVKLGGEAGGEGGYHVGVSVGNVRALFHPGYQKGEFRFEQVDTHQHLTENSSMGFVPTVGKLRRMSIDVKRVAGGKVELDVVVTDGDKIFSAPKILEGSVIGKLDHISLDRSGRTGGDALFDDLVVDLGPR